MGQLLFGAVFGLVSLPFILVFGVIFLILDLLFGGGGSPPTPTPPTPTPPTPTPPTPTPPTPTRRFNIRLFRTSGTSRYDSLFIRAATQWESVVVGDLPDITGLGNIDLFDGDLSTTSTAFGISSVDDLVIGFEFVDTLGPTTLGRAGPRFIRSSSDRSPISGIMQFNTELFDRNSEANNFATVLHEMGHVLGIGTLFDNAGCDGGCQTNGLGAVYPCSQGIRAYRELRASTTENFGLTTLRLSNDGGGGSQCSHWEDDNFRARNWIEVMTPFSSPRTALLTRVSVASLRDISPSYVVNEAAADPIPRSADEEVTGGIKLTNANGELDNRGEVFLLKARPIAEVLNVRRHAS